LQQKRNLNSFGDVVFETPPTVVPFETQRLNGEIRHKPAPAHLRSNNAAYASFCVDSRWSGTGHGAKPTAVVTRHRLSFIDIKPAPLRQ
jgi:hypothetical protein